MTNAKQNKVIVHNKVQKNNSRSFRIQKDQAFEYDVDVEIEEEGEYEVDKLSVTELPAAMPDGTQIRWFTNFSIKKNGQFINQKYTVKIANLAGILGNSKLVIFDGNGNPYYYTGEILEDSIEMTDGDPGFGGSPP